jgi:RHS repeat-associated protein
MSLLAETEIQTATAAPAILYEYVWFNGHPVGQVDSGTTTHWTFTDHLGTPIIQTDDAGAVYWRAEYEPFGRVFSLRTADQHQPLRLPGQEAEQLNLGPNGATERSYNIFRWYRPSWGRYTQTDPVDARESLNPFSYALDNPLTLYDSLGLAVLLRCRDVGTPGKFEVTSWLVRNVAGAKHCFFQVTCPSQGIPPTLISYLGLGTVTTPDDPHNNDASYSRSGNYQQALIPPKGPNGCCGFEKCFLRKAHELAGQRMVNYHFYGPNSNSFARRLIDDCGGQAPEPLPGSFGFTRGGDVVFR